MANYVTKYRSEIASLAGVIWKIDIQEDSFVGDITTLLATGDPLHFEFDSDSDTFNDPVRASKVTVNVYSQTDFQLLDLYSDQDFKFRVLIYADDVLFWQGFNVPGEYQEPYTCIPYPVSLTFIDGLNYLKDIKYAQSETIYASIETVVYYEGRKFESQIICDILNKIQITGFREYVNIYDIEMDNALAASPFDQATLDVDVFRDKSCWEVLFEICKSYNAVIRQSQGEIVIYRPTELAQSTIYGRIFTAFNVKTATSYSPDQYINRLAVPSGLRQFPDSTLMIKRPAKKITINQDYGFKQSFISNFDMKGNTITGSGIIYDLQMWTKTNLYLIQPTSIIGESSGIVIIGKNTLPARDHYLHQTFGEYLITTLDIMYIEFDYKIINNTAIAYTSQNLSFKLCDVANNYYLVHADASSCSWDNALNYFIVQFDAPIGVSDWVTIKRAIPELPIEGPYKIELYGLESALIDVYIAYRNIRMYSTSDEVVLKTLPFKKPKGEIFYWSIDGKPRQGPRIHVLKDNVEIVQKTYILENTKNGQRIKGIDLTGDYLLGDVVDSNVENVVEQFEGAKAVGIVLAYTGAIDKVDTATFHITTGTGTVSCNGYSETITWNTSVSQTLDDFMTAHSGDFGTVVLAKTSGTTLTFTGDFDFASASVSASFGTAVNTIPYYIGDASYSLAPTSEWSTYAPGGEHRPLLEIIAGEIGFQYSRPKQLIQMKIHDNLLLIPYSGHGLLYNWYAVDTELLAPVGWHIPTLAEWLALETFLGDNHQGGRLKETGTTHWLTPNTGATNDTGFTALGSGYRIHNGAFQKRGEYFRMWLADIIIAGSAYDATLFYNSNTLFPSFEAGSGGDPFVYGQSVRCLLDGVDPADPGSVTDIDGNIYPTVKIGTQVWMANNLRVTKLNNGVSIPEYILDAAWVITTTPGRCWYNNIAE
jgi:uncharacterized protein (TIGR02145 family)